MSQPENGLVDQQYRPLDLYIMIPCMMEKSRSLWHMASTPSGVSRVFLDTITEISNYEMDDGLTSQLTRHWLGQVNIIGLTDHVKDKVELGRETVNVYLSMHKETSLACVTLAFPNLALPVTHLLDQMSRNEILMDDQGEKKFLLDWLDVNYGLKRMGMCRSFTNLTSEIEVQELMYLLANEANGSQVMKHRLIGSCFEEAAKKNVAQYDMSEVYVQEGSIVQIYKESKDRYEDRIADHVLTLFIMELILMQVAAISRVSHRVSKELHEKSDISLKFIEELNLDFSKTMFLWNLYYSKYSATQELVNSFIKGFKIREQLDIYTNNKSYLEGLINVHTVLKIPKELDSEYWHCVLNDFTGAAYLL